MSRLAFLAPVLVALTFPAAADSVLRYSPESVSVTVAPGSVGSVPFAVGLGPAGGRTYFVWTLDRQDGTIPAGWLSASPRTGFANEWNPVAATLRVAVPADAAPGTYVSQLWAKAMAAHGFADAATGMRVEVNVPSRCIAAPAVEIDEFGPEVIWPPDHRLDAVIVRGRIRLPEGCTLFEAGYSIDDEYGLLTGVGTLALGVDGAFAVSLPVQASRDGRDRDGRRYRVTVFAENEMGISTSPVLEALVPHDRR